MRRTSTRLVFVAVCLIAGALLVGVAAFNSRVASHFGYAVPGAHGLPLVITVRNRHYSAAHSCWSQQYLTQKDMWPLHSVGEIPTLLGPAHTIYSSLTGGAVSTLLFTPAGNCYDVYVLEGGP